MYIYKQIEEEFTNYLLCRDAFVFITSSDKLKSPEASLAMLRIHNSRKIQENALIDVADPAASRTCLFPSPFPRESGGDGDSLPTARNFGA